MRLTHIKLAGFKSFVDPATIVTSGQLVAVCGPNGCGKSNVIDAVRWVLGESSAKQLRGESMQDVIFNGSSSRKAASRASVELVFDNSAGLAAGQWSQYAEISIKRLLTRQGESSYYINNLQVRRRDITDLFLGTGVGKGGYAIIEQGMISRIIEAKPEELRHFLEEAAGVSKYKERRRETESRLADTRDNLDRVEDIRLELEGQIGKLSIQAEVASEYHRIREAITEKQNLLALQRKLDAAHEVEQARRAMDQAQNELESRIAQQRELEALIETLREEHYGSSDAMHEAQAELYEANAAVARQEQQLLHLRQMRERLGQQQRDLQTEIQRIDEEQRSTAATLTDWQSRREEAVLQSEEAALLLAEESARLPELQASQQDADQECQLQRDQQASLRQAVELSSQQLQHHDRTLQSLQNRLLRLQSESREMAAADLDGLQEAQLQVETLRMETESALLTLSDAEEALAMTGESLEVAQSARESLRLEQAALLAREQALAGTLVNEDDAGMQQWLISQGLADSAQLLTSLDIDPEWSTALEVALGSRLQARLASSPANQDAPGVVSVVLRGESDPVQQAQLPGCVPLLSKLECREAGFLAALQDWLAGVWCLEDATHWQALRTQLPAQGMLITQQGLIYGRHAIEYPGQESAQSGTIRRLQALAHLQQQIQELTPRLQQEETRVAETSILKREQVQAVHQARQCLQQAREHLAKSERELIRLQEACGQAERRQQEIGQELTLLQDQLGEESLQRESCLLELTEAKQQLEPLAQALEQAMEQQQAAKLACEALRQQLQQYERAAQEARFAVQAADVRQTELQRREQELQERRAEQEERLQNMLLELEEIDERDFDVGFQAAIDLRAEKERTLVLKREALNSAQARLRERESEKMLLETTLEPAREAVNSQKLKEQEARIAVERFVQELQEAGVDEEALRPALGTGLKISHLVAEIGRLTQAISGLGAVNLAALEELDAARERKNYLDSQSADLVEAMETLEGAIRRIDRDTRALLSDTFNSVNASLQELFPALFGGGHAELILTGEEILDAGLQIMAQPPGKKNSTIHLLSGGEKALTALSLVFSLFRLNPAPFCLLDEVDAPLDDANTLRYCDLVKKMSERTQFLFISHNRLAMEMAQQLVGVTMQEQGVSRVVAVDIEQALSMREAENV